MSADTLFSGVKELVRVSIDTRLLLIANEWVGSDDTHCCCHWFCGYACPSDTRRCLFGHSFILDDTRVGRYASQAFSTRAGGHAFICICCRIHVPLSAHIFTGKTRVSI